VWTHPELAGLMVTAVEAALTAAMPKLAGYFGPRAHKLRLEFDDSMKFAVTRAGELTPDDRYLLTSHDTMRYFAGAFGLEARALAPAGGKVPDRITPELREWIRARNIKSLFRESITDVLALRSLMQESKVDPDHVIYTLTLPAAGTTGVVNFMSYDVGLAAGSLRHNIDRILSRLPVD
jgi:ABC-type Zn uptake system ZnuABC Zn-binding protein ZnuA